MPFARAVLAPRGAPALVLRCPLPCCPRLWPPRLLRLPPAQCPLPPPLQLHGCGAGAWQRVAHQPACLSVHGRERPRHPQPAPADGAASHQPERSACAGSARPGVAHLVAGSCSKCSCLLGGCCCLMTPRQPTSAGQEPNPSFNESCPSGRALCTTPQFSENCTQLISQHYPSQFSQARPRDACLQLQQHFDALVGILCSSKPWCPARRQAGRSYQAGRGTTRSRMHLLHSALHACWS